MVIAQSPFVAAQALRQTLHRLIEGRVRLVCVGTGVQFDTLADMG